MTPSKQNKKTAPWTRPMPEDQFAFLVELLGAPSPIGMEGAMTNGVLAPRIESFMPKSWVLHRFRGNAGLVADTAPDRPDAFTVMAIGHADKIRMQVRSIGDDGKIWINSESFLPCTLIGHEAILFSENPKKPGKWRSLRGGTIEAIGAIHFADPELRAGRKGITPEMLYLELHIHGDEKKQQVEALGIRAGDPLLLDRTVRRGHSPDTFVGPYLDNGLGCFVVAEALRLLAEEGGLKNVRFLAAFAAYEEVGRLGSRVLAQEFPPDVLIGVDVSHDLLAAPGVGDKRFTPNTMGKGFTLASGSIVSAQLNSIYAEAVADQKIPMQWKVVGRDTGTDAMAAVFASVDAAATSIGFPVRNMHTMSEAGHTGDVLAAVHGLVALLRRLDSMHKGSGATAEDFRTGHPRLDQATPLV